MRLIENILLTLIPGRAKITIALFRWYRLAVLHPNDFPAANGLAYGKARFE